MSDKQNKTKKPRTLLEHLGRDPASHYGSVNLPVYRVSTALFPNLKSFRAQSQIMTYGRKATPSSLALGDEIARLEGGAQCFLTPSGLSAVACAILASVNAKEHILIADCVYQPTRNLCNHFLQSMGIDCDFYDPIDLDALEKMIRPNTKAIFVESPGSLTFEVQDIPAIAELARRHNIIVIMDNSWATPLYFKPFEHGVDISVQAATKYLCGHADLLLGAITANEKCRQKVEMTHRLLGLCASGDDIYLTLRGLRTLDVRLERHQKTALLLAEFLASRDEVVDIIHPALPNHQQHDIFKRDFLGATGLFAFQLKPYSENQLARMFDGFELFSMGYSWGGFESLIIPTDPVRNINPWTRHPLIRIHAGLEDEDDLINDLKAGLERL